jgi:uncharacterized protein (UPF0371 family)
MPVAFFGVLLGTLLVWTMAIGPQPIKKQMVICYKFNENTAKAQIEQHFLDFKMLKGKTPEIVDYTAGFTTNSEENSPKFDAMHYLTFKSEEDIEKFKVSKLYTDFIETHSVTWKDQMIINAEVK